MSCLYHSERSAVNTCSKCGAWLCDGCSVEIDGRIVCKACIARQIGGAAEHEHKHRESRAAHIYDAPLHSRVSGFLLFCFSALPGANYMYMGLIKRGLFMMAAFFASIYLVVALGPLPFAFIIPILVATSFFDGFRLRRHINAGETVEDGFGEVREFIRANRTVVLAGLAVLFIWTLLDRFWNFVESILPFSLNLGWLIPWFFIGLGCYVVFRRKDGGSKPRQ